MHTTQILFQITDNLSKNPAIITQLPWDDIRLCITTELEDRRILYSPSEYHSLMEHLQEKFILIDTLCSVGDVASVMQHLSEIIFALQLLPDNNHAWETYYQSNFNQACLKHYKQDTIIVLGDSHVNFFSGNELLSFLPMGNDINTCTATDFPYAFTPLHLGPCLAYNCNRYDTTFRFREKLEFLCEHFIKPNATIICCLGEIDLRVHVFQQTLRQNKTYQEIVDGILEQYLALLLSMKERGYKFYVWGAIASQPEDCPIDPNFPRNGSEEERNRATAYFNQQLAKLCAAHNIGFLSVFDQMITPDFKTRAEYLSEDRCHLGQRALPLAITEWKKLNHPSFQNSPL